MTFLKSRLAPTARRRIYPALGVLMSLGAPAGLMFVRALIQGEVPGWSHAAGELLALPEVYGYVFLSTAFVFIGLGWLLGWKEDQLRDRSLRDPLTGLWNRRHLNERLWDELARGLRYGTPISLLLVDVDRLKDINDTFGHAAGDRALRAVADGIAETCRAADLAARTGGDEFAVMAPHTTAGEALELANRIRAALASPAGAAAGPVPRVSVGVADDRAAGSFRPEALFAAADAALYAAKAAGRDCAVVARGAGRDGAGAAATRSEPEEKRHALA